MKVSSKPHLLMMASTSTWMGLLSESRWMMSNACLTIRTASSFLPLLRPCIIKDAVSLRRLHKLNRGLQPCPDAACRVHSHSKTAPASDSPVQDRC